MPMHEDDGDTRDYDVGYGKPPKKSRFKKGQSGNPKGRPKGAKGFRANLKREMESKITVREGGREIRISKAEAAGKQLMAKALKGDIKALSMLADLDLETSDPQEGRTTPNGQEPDQTDDAILKHFAAQIASDTLGDKKDQK